MKKVVIIGANDFQNPLILKAKELGYETHVFAWQDGSIGERTADFFYPISITEKEKILEKCYEIRPDAVASIGSDLAVPVIIYLQQHLGHKGNSERCAIIATNKYEMRSALKQADIMVPNYVKIKATEQNYEDAVKKEGVKLPAIVKPTDRSGSRGIMKITEWSQLQKAVEEAQNNSFEHAAIVEEFIEGEEYSCESISFKGTHHCLAITKKYTTGYPHFIETGHLEPAEFSEEMRQRIYAYVKSCLDALEIRFGASHAEFKVDAEGNIRIIEVGARMGGDCIGSHLVELSTGYDFLKMVLDVSLGKEMDMMPKSASGVSYIKFIFEEEDLKTLEMFKKQYADKISFISEIDTHEHAQVTNSSNRYGYYIMRFENMEEARSVLKL